MPSSIIAALATLLAAAATPTRRIPVEVVSTDQVGQTITVRQPGRLNVATSETPEDTSIVTLPVQTGALDALRTARNGYEVLITCAAVPPAEVLTAEDAKDDGTAAATDKTRAVTTSDSTRVRAPAAAGTAAPLPGGAAIVTVSVRPLSALGGNCNVASISAP
jgi:hypothetical protein